VIDEVLLQTSGGAPTRSEFRPAPNNTTPWWLCHRRTRHQHQTVANNHQQQTQNRSKKNETRWKTRQKKPTENRTKINKNKGKKGQSQQKQTGNNPKKRYIKTTHEPPASD
jgi:hypothetical protein